MIFVKRQYFIDAITKACKIAQDDDTRFYANGIWFDATSSGLRLVASDALRLYCADIPCHVDTPSSLLVARKPLAKMLRVLKAGTSEYIEIDLQETQAVIDDYPFPFIAGNYPPYEQAIPQRPFKFGGKIPTKDWLDALKLLAKVCDKNDLFTLKGDRGEAYTHGVCEATVTLPWIGGVPYPFVEQGISIHYNIVHLSQILSCCGTKASLDWEVPTRPMQITPDATKFPEFFLLVPTRF